VKDNEMDTLKEKVIASLRKASEPSYTECTFSFGVDSNDNNVINPGKQRKLGNLFRNEVRRCFTIMDTKQF